MGESWEAGLEAVAVVQAGVMWIELWHVGCGDGDNWKVLTIYFGVRARTSSWSGCGG